MAMKSCKTCLNWNHGIGNLSCDFCDFEFEDRWEPMKVKINTHGNPMPVKNGEWWDLTASEDVSFMSGDMKIIPLGVSVKPPQGWHFLVASRSSTPLKYGLIISNGIGIIEDNYCGDNDILGLVCYATKAVCIQKGTRVAQMTLVQKPPQFDFVEVESMDEADRGGYGSTGE